MSVRCASEPGPACAVRAPGGRPPSLQSRPVPDAALLSLVAARWEAHPATGTSAPLVLAAFRGREAVLGVLGGEDGGGATTEPAASRAPDPVHLAAITVEGFRGIGERATLRLHPAPGLTLVVGRNGSGKSSFSEALEILLLGTNRRWDRRSPVWRDGWRNLHHRHTVIEARFAADGRREPLVVSRRWDDGAGLQESTLSVGGRQRSLESIGWAQPLASYPPLLSHHELESALDDTPSHLYDALAGILGLGDLRAAQETLRGVRLDLERAVRAAGDPVDALVRRLEDSADERAATVLAALRSRPWDLDAIGETLSGEAAADEGSTLRRLSDLAALPVLAREELEATVRGLRDADRLVTELQRGEGARADELADLLERALEVHAHAAGQTACPVCGTAGVLTYAWRRHTGERLRSLREDAEALRAARARREAAIAGATLLVTAVPAPLTESGDPGVPVEPALQAWRRWSAIPEGGDAQRLAAHLQERGQQLIAAVAELRRSAREELDRRQRTWRPIADTLVTWLPAAREARAAAERVPAVRAAETWLRDAHDELRDERFRPIAEAVQANWSALRQDSNVSLGVLRLAGASTRRQLVLDGSVDGEAAPLLGVMSQGELNCLALSLFLPRASQPESPFRFVVIDDPVQAMDPSKVEGLATALASAARERQVVVLTHDTRLPEAVRFLRLPATVIEVARREGSMVELRELDSPVRRHIDDALAVARSDGLPPEARRVVAGFCRMALEAAATRAVAQRMRREGRRFADVEAELERPTTLLMLLALALFGDASRSADVVPRLARDEPGAAETLRICNRGAHGGAIPGDPAAFVRVVESLTRLLAPPEPAGG